MPKKLRNDLEEIEINNVRNDKTFQLRVSESTLDKLDYLSRYYNFADKSKLLKSIIEELYDKLH